MLHSLSHAQSNQHSEYDALLVVYRLVSDRSYSVYRARLREQFLLRVQDPISRLPCWMKYCSESRLSSSFMSLRMQEVISPNFLHNVTSSAAERKVISMTVIR